MGYYRLKIPYHAVHPRPEGRGFSRFLVNVERAFLGVCGMAHYLTLPH
ncbi:MAG: hypothetical protein ACYDEV_14400 [Acidiferrobacter sp.]